MLGPGVKMPDFFKNNLLWFLSLVFASAVILTRLELKVEAMEPVKKEVQTLTRTVDRLADDIEDSKKDFEKYKEEQKKASKKLNKSSNSINEKLDTLIKQKENN